MKKMIGGFLGFGKNTQLTKCDRCGKETSGDVGSEFNPDGYFESLVNGDYCLSCLKIVDKDASHLWIALNGEDNHFKKTFISETDSSPPSHLDYCSRCYTYRIIEKIGNSLKAKYYEIGFKNSKDNPNACSGNKSFNLDGCRHDYVTILSTERTPTSDDINEKKRMLKELKSSEIGQIFGYTDRDMNRSLYGERFYWCCKCGHSRVITKGQLLPAIGTDKNFPSYYST